MSDSAGGAGRRAESAVMDLALAPTVGTSLPTRHGLRRSHLWAATAIALLNGLDIVTTRLVLDRGGIEANPIAELLIEWDFLGPLKLLLVVTTAAGAYFHRSTLRLVNAAWFVAGIYVLVIVSNLMTLARYT